MINLISIIKASKKRVLFVFYSIWPVYFILLDVHLFSKINLQRFKFHFHLLASLYNFATSKGECEEALYAAKV